MSRMIPTLLLCILLFLFLALGCQRDSTLSLESTLLPTGGNSVQLSENPPLDTCSTSECIDSYLTNFRSQALHGAGELVVLNTNDPYALSSHYALDPGSPEHIEFILSGNSSSDRPVLTFNGQLSWDGSIHANLHFVGSPDGSYVKFKDVIINHNSYMRGGVLPGIQFEGGPNVELDNVKLGTTSSATTHFMTTGTVTLNNCELSNRHELAFGPEGWCGRRSCGSGLGDPMPADGSEIKNSTLYGNIFFDVHRPVGGDTILFYMRNNNPLTNLKLNANDGASLKVFLEGNTFANGESVIVDIDNEFVVEARENATSKGPCRTDAMKDFDYSGSSLDSVAVQLKSWKYNGVVYCQPKIQEFFAGRNGNTVYVEWSTECTATSVVKWGTNCNSLPNTAAGSDVEFHEVSFGVPSDEGCIYLKAISAIPGCACEADTSQCTAVVKGIVISNILTSFDALRCRFTIVWTTNVKSSSKVYFGASCSSLSHTATGSNNVTTHVVVCDVSGISGAAFAYKVESSNACDSEQSSCTTIHKDKCIGQ